MKKILIGIPEWLKKEEKLFNLKSEGKGLNLNILEIISVLHHIQSVAAFSNHYFRRINPLLKLVFVFETVLLLSLSRSLFFIIGMTSGILFLLSLMEARDILAILGVASLASLFSSLALFPSLLWGNYHNFAFLITKIADTVILLNIFSRTTRWREIVRALKWLRISDVFILMLDVTQRFIFLLGEVAVHMLIALKIRYYRKVKMHDPFIRIIGTLFLKSKFMSEEVFSSMICRGFNGLYTVKPIWFKVGDIPVAFLVILTLAFFIMA